MFRSVLRPQIILPLPIPQTPISEHVLPPAPWLVPPTILLIIWRGAAQQFVLGRIRQPMEIPWHICVLRPAQGLNIGWIRHLGVFGSARLLFLLTIPHGIACPSAQITLLPWLLEQIGHVWRTAQQEAMHKIRLGLVFLCARQASCSGETIRLGSASGPALRLQTCMPIQIPRHVSTHVPPRLAACNYTPMQEQDHVLWQQAVEVDLWLTPQQKDASRNVQSKYHSTRTPHWTYVSIPALVVFFQATQQWPVWLNVPLHQATLAITQIQQTSNVCNTVQQHITNILQIECVSWRALVLIITKIT